MISKVRIARSDALRTTNNGSKRENKSMICRRLGQCSQPRVLLVDCLGAAAADEWNMDISESEILKMANELSSEQREEAAIELERLAGLLRKSPGGTAASPFPWQSAPRSFRLRNQ